MSKASTATTFYQLSEEEKQDLFAEQKNNEKSTDSASSTSVSQQSKASSIPCGICAVPDEDTLEKFSAALCGLLPMLKTRKKAEYAENMAKLIELLTKISQSAMSWCSANRAQIEEFIAAIELQDVTRKEISAKVEEYVQSMNKELETMRRNTLVNNIETLLSSPLLDRKYKKAIFVVAEMADLPLKTKEI